MRNQTGTTILLGNIGMNRLQLDVSNCLSKGYTRLTLGTSPWRMPRKVFEILRNLSLTEILRFTQKTRDETS
jgi:hypothetical protein